MEDLDADLVMEEGSILRSTELNGHPETVDPSVFALHGTALKELPATTGHFPQVLSPTPPHVTNFTALSRLAVNRAGLSPISSTAEDGTDEMEVVSHIRQPSPQVVITPKPEFPALPYSSRRSGVVYDTRMRFHSEIIPSTQDDDDLHPEDPKRIYAIWMELVAAGLVYDENVPPGDDADYRLWRVAVRRATMEEICLVHDPTHYKWVKGLEDRPDEELVELAHDYDSIYLNQTTWQSATLSAGGAIEACRAVITGAVKNVVAVIRPPGHHAEHSKPSGFCFFNNVCVAAKVCQRDFPDFCRKVLILDWDVHHGNGVQQAFYDDPNVLYISLHVHMNGKFYPAGDYGDHLHCGEGAGKGKNVNIPWDTNGMGDGDYMLAFQEIVMPIAQEFDPDLVIVSAGFDAAEGDKLGGCHVSPACYGHMTHMLMSLAQGKIAVCLEGGYNLRSIAKSTLAVTRTLMGEPPDRLITTEPTGVGVNTVNLVRRQQSRFWKCMFPKDITKPFADVQHAERLHDVIRAWQSKVMYDEFHMTPLFIRREKISKSFENEVLATPNYHEARPLLVIFHDPPEVLGIPNPRTNRLELHNTWITDASKAYIDWAIKHDFGVIDVNIPKHITGIDNSEGYVESDNLDIRANLTRELATYLWENYIEVNESTHVFLMGIGAAYSGLVDLLSNNEQCSNTVTHIVSFVAENALQAVRRPTDDYFPSWYYQHSDVFVASNHAAFDPERTRKPRKKYGRLHQSSKENLNEMLVEHRSEVTEILDEETHEWRLEMEEQEEQKRIKLEMENAAAHTMNGVALRPQERQREVVAGSLPTMMRTPGKPPPLGTFSLGVASGTQSPRTPKR